MTSTVERILDDAAEAIARAKAAAEGEEQVMRFADFARYCETPAQAVYTAISRDPDRLTVKRDPEGKSIGIVLDEKAERFRNRPKRAKTEDAE